MGGLEPDPTGAGRVERVSPGYPARLLAGERPPAVLYFSGRLPRDEERPVALVGSRAASGRGRALAFDLAAALGRRGHAIVSGGAFGIDAAAHEGALSAGQATFAVLACGVDVVYPDRHGALFARIARGGGLLSEHPPGTPPRRRQFPTRNRIIAALADLVIVVEASARSGALITAGCAAACGRRLLAVPGSAGTDALLASGTARPLLDVASLDDALAGRTRAPAGADDPWLAALPDTPAGLARRLGRPLAEVLAALGEAELAGRVRRGPGNRYEVLRGH